MPASFLHTFCQCPTLNNGCLPDTVSTYVHVSCLIDSLFILVVGKMATDGDRDGAAQAAARAPLPE